MKSSRSKVAATASVVDTGWRKLYKVGGTAALLAGVLFRRNIAVEVALLTKRGAPATVTDWFALLQDNRLLGLTYLHIFDVVNYGLLALMFLALYAALRQWNQSAMASATGLAFLGIATYFSSNTALNMLSLSDQFASAATEAERSMLLSTGQTMLELGRFSSTGAHPGSGGFLSLLLIAIASMIVSVVMLRSNAFKRVTAYVGILVSLLDLVYCAAYAFAPAINGEVLAVYCIPAAGLLLMVWHIMVGWRLCRLARLEGKK